jgi:hypothetical protein
MSANPATGYSAAVRLRLEAEGQSFELAQIGPEKVILRAPASLPPCRAEVVMDVDDFTRRWLVALPEGIAADCLVVRTIPQDEGTH